MILVTGATSQVGIVLVGKLLAQGQKVRCLVRETSDIDVLYREGVEFLYGDIEDIQSLRAAVNGVESIVHIAGIWRVRALLEACRQEDFKGRAIFIGSTSRFKKLESIDPKEKTLAGEMCKAEKLIAGSGMDYVILRPTMLYGLDRDKNILQIIKFMRRFKCYPLIGSGTAYKHPVYVGDVAAAVVDCISSEAVAKKEYIIAGATPIKHREMLEAIRKNLPFKAYIIRVPVFFAYIAVFLYKLFKPAAYINYAMVKRVNEDVSYDIGPAQRDFGYSPVDFLTGVRKQIDYLITNELL